MKNDKKDLIEKMKKNRVMTYLLTKEEKDCIESAGDNIQYYTNRWDVWEDTNQGLCNTLTYRIKKNYQPEPKAIKCKAIKCEVVEKNYQIRYRYKNVWLPLHLALSDPNFIDALDKDGRPMELRCRVLGQETPAEYPKYVLFASK